MRQTVGESGQPAEDAPAVQKLMSITEREFHRSLRRLLPGITILSGQRRFNVSEGNGQVTIDLEPTKSAVLGGLMRLERYRVTISFAGLNSVEADNFVERFDRTFQRGGG